jgi:hypothetical protein
MPPAFCLARAIRSGNVVMPLSGEITRMFGELPSAATGMKSFAVS